MKDTTAIVYSPGSYGTYLEWCLSSLTNDIDITSPFTEIGSSHNFTGVSFSGIDDWNEFLSTSLNPPFVRFHPKTKSEHNLSKNLDFVCQTAQSVVYLYPDVDHVLLCLNNYMTKLVTNWWRDHLIPRIDKSIIYQNWPVSPDTSIDEIPIWVKREFLSYYLMSSWFDQVEWYHPSRWSNPKACIVTTKELLFDFESTLIKIQQHCKLHYTKPISALSTYHQKNLSLQANLTQDELCKKIIASVLDGTNFSWGKLPLGSEVWIQWELRNLGREICCNGLDEFPRNSLELIKLLDSV